LESEVAVTGPETLKNLLRRIKGRRRRKIAVLKAV
jgi:hypothetical protein